jgi:ribonuclease BN (tRNA processing enzyme)
MTDSAVSVRRQAAAEARRVHPNRLVTLALMALVGCSTDGSSRATATASARLDCPKQALALQVLGSGGPMIDDERASSGYVIWVQGESRLLIDAGGGIFQRFSQSSARLESLDAIALSHFHVDHSADLIALLKGGYFIERTRALPIIGPSGSDLFPSTEAYLRALLDSTSGAYRYLSGYIEGGRGWFQLVPRVVDASGATPDLVVDRNGLQLQAVGVRHGHVPALGFVVTVLGKKIAFTGDQDGQSEAFVALARDADVLVAHHAIPETDDAALRALHMTPSAIGDLAAVIAPGRLVLSHIMQRALERRGEGEKAIRRRYQGPLDYANDLDCFVVD